LDDKPIAWAEVIAQGDASGDLAVAYGAVTGADGQVESLYLAMSRTPRAIQPADAHYLALLRNLDNPLEPWLSELISTYVAVLCGCDYAVQNHGANFSEYLDDPDQYQTNRATHERIGRHCFECPAGKGRVSSQIMERTKTRAKDLG